MEATRKNTLKIVFGPTAKAPKNLDVLRFVGGKLSIPAESVHSIYKDENDHAFYIKFLDENEFNCFGTGLEEQYIFEYDDGSRTPVRIDLASRLFRYVRIFNLPPEIDDREIAAVLSQFGSIRQHVRERYPAEFGYSVFSGIRGVHMEIAKELPANMYISHFKVRIFYEGLKNRCFYCKNDGHLKANCPKLASTKSPQNGGQYSQVLANAAIGASATSSGSLNMTTIPVKATSVKPVSVGLQDIAAPSVVDSTVVVTNGSRENRPSGEDRSSQGDNRAIPENRSTEEKRPPGVNSSGGENRSTDGEKEPSAEQADGKEHMDIAENTSAGGKNPLKRVPDSTSDNDSSESDETKQREEKGKPKKKQTLLESNGMVSPIDAISSRNSRSKNRSRSHKHQ